MTARGSTKPTTIITVIHEGRCIGSILSRSPQGFEAYDGADRSIGVFKDRRWRQSGDPSIEGGITTGVREAEESDSTPRTNREH